MKTLKDLEIIPEIENPYARTKVTDLKQAAIEWYQKIGEYIQLAKDRKLAELYGIIEKEWPESKIQYLSPEEVMQQMWAIQFWIKMFFNLEEDLK